MAVRLDGSGDYRVGAEYGPNCKGEQKLVRLRGHLAADSWAGESHAYGDSTFDLPVLRWATHGFLVGRRGELNRV